MDFKQSGASIRLNPIKLNRISHGGYSISYIGKAPYGCRVFLAVPDLKHSIEVTHRPAHSLLDAKVLVQFLALIGNQNLWGRTISCQILIVKGNQIVMQSSAEPFNAPVRPYVGQLGPRLGAVAAGPPLRYTGSGRGRMLHFPAIDGCYYFMWNNVFETDESMRGFDCTTYAGAVFGVDASTGALNGYGTKLANHLGAKPCDLENKTGEEIKAHFAKNGQGTFLMWNASHVVVLANSTVHEFCHSKGGYRATTINEWGFHGRYWVRKPKTQFC